MRMNELRAANVVLTQRQTNHNWIQFVCNASVLLCRRIASDQTEVNQRKQLRSESGCAYTRRRFRSKQADANSHTIRLFCRAAVTAYSVSMPSSSASSSSSLPAAVHMLPIRFILLAAVVRLACAMHMLATHKSVCTHIAHHTVCQCAPLIVHCLMFSWTYKKFSRLIVGTHIANTNDCGHRCTRKNA